MPNQGYKPEQIVNLLRKIEVEIANGKTTPQAAREVGITEQTYYRWRKKFGGLKLDQAKRLKELEKENSRLKRLVAELSLEKQVLRDVARETSKPRAEALCGRACARGIRIERTACLPAAGARARHTTVCSDSAQRRVSGLLSVEDVKEHQHTEAREQMNQRRQ